MPGLPDGISRYACCLLLAAIGVTLPPAARADRRHPASAAELTDAARPRAFAIAVLGDGFGEALAEGLSADLAGEPTFKLIQATHAPYGLAQTPRFDWTTSVTALLDGPPVDAAVIMLGANDVRPLKQGDEVLDPGTPQWRALYGSRVQAVAALFGAKRVPLTWVGLPIVENEQTSADFTALNQIMRDRAVAGGATYLDSWDAFADENGRYDAFGPDQNGKRTRLRTGDGVDFTRAGAIKLAGFVEAGLRRDAADRAPAPVGPGDVVVTHQPGFDSALAIDVTAQIRREAGLPALPANGPQAATGQASAGPVIAMTAPVLAPDGRLVGATAEPASLAGAGGGTLVQRVLTEGQPIPPKPGRIDDFSWPRR